MKAQQAKTAGALGILPIAAAVEISPEYVACKMQGDYRAEFYGNLRHLKRGRVVLTYCTWEKVPTFALVRVISTRTDQIGDPLIRVTDGAQSWRIADCFLLSAKEAYAQGADPIVAQVEATGELPG